MSSDSYRIWLTIEGVLTKLCILENIKLIRIMHVPSQIAKHINEVYFGGNWTCSNVKAKVEDLNWEQATTSLYSFNSIATLVQHINYYVAAVSKVLEGEALVAKDADSFAHPPIDSEEDWRAFLEKVWTDGEKFTSLIAGLEEKKLWENFTDEKYGIYYRNLIGIIEHTHYHLGQIALIKKMLLHETKA